MENREDRVTLHPYGNGQPDQIDSLHIKNKEANTNEIENLQIFIIIGQNAHLMKRLISLLLLFCIGLPLLAQQQRPAQTPKRDQKKKEVAEIDTIPLYNGTYVGVDIYGIGSKLLGGDFMSSEVSVAVNLKNKFIPTIEFGMGGTDTWSETGIHYKSKWPHSSESVWTTTPWQRRKRRTATCMQDFATVHSVHLNMTFPQCRQMILSGEM